MQQNKFVFKSHVAKDGSIETKAFDPDKAKVIEAKLAKAPLMLTASDPEDEALRNALRDEFSETPRDPRNDLNVDEYEREDG
jgi:hypothetical protein